MRKRSAAFLKGGTVIQLSGWKGFRLVGGPAYWQLQTEAAPGEWKNARSYPSLHDAALGAFDYAVVNDVASILSVKEFSEVCERARNEFTEAAAALYELER